MPRKKTVVMLSLIAGLFASAGADAALPPPPSAGYSAEVFSFFCIAGCSDTPSVENQLFLQVIRDTDPTNGVDPNVYFKFWNLVGIASSVEQVSIDGASGFTLLAGSGTNFVAANTPNPKNLPGGNNAVPPFGSDFTYEAVASGPGGKPVAGIDTNTDTLEFFTSGPTFSQVISEIGSGQLRFGEHVIAFANGGSATYINDPTPVPEPSSYAMLLAGLGLVGLLALRRVPKLA